MSRHDIIVIGASAGGIRPLQILVAGLPRNLAASLFIVIHIPALLPSALPQILNYAKTLPAFHAEENMLIEQGKIYVAPPDHHLLLANGCIHLGTGPKERHVRPAADVLFRSAALAYGPRVVGIVLSGMDQDGTAGLSDIKRHGGITIVQDPKEAEFPSMPQRALDHCIVDYTMFLAAMIPLLTDLAGVRL